MVFEIDQVWGVPFSDDIQEVGQSGTNQRNHETQRVFAPRFRLEMNPRQKRRCDEDQQRSRIQGDNKSDARERVGLTPQHPSPPHSEVQRHQNGQVNQYEAYQGIF